MRALLSLSVALLLAPADSLDPLASEIHRWSAFLSSDAANAANFSDLKGGMTPVITRAEDALRDGRRLLALQRFSIARTNLEAAAWAATRPAEEHKDDAQFEAEWRRFGASLPKSRPNLESIHPAAIRAMAEIAVPQVREFYDASLLYSRNTSPETGLFYLGSSTAQLSFIDFARKLALKPDGRLPPVRSLAGDIDSLQRELLAAYRPPASIDRHAEFIAASSTLKEARELDAAGLHYGALLRYLEAARRVGQIRGTPIETEAINARLRDYQSKLNAGIDHSVARLLIETAQSDLAAPPKGGPAVATSIATWALPRYFTAIGPANAAKAAAPLPDAVTVTLVRWPYT